MANPQGSSFIPKRPTKGKVKAGGFRKIYLLSYVSYIFFFCTLIVTVSIFFYEMSLETQLEQQKQRLLKINESFDQKDLERIRELENRITAATKRLDSHVSVSSLFDAFEQSTVDPVRLLGFEYTRSVADTLEFSVSAITDSFDTLLFQKEILMSNETLRSSDISDVALNTVVVNKESEDIQTDQVVSFSISATLDSDAIQYKGLSGDALSKINQLLGREENYQTAQESTVDQEFENADEVISSSEAL